ncbi:putative CDC50/LEM3 family protein [Septoria linicola]|nr:putative CDC50/LEM3 family protein [Septoria linicola]
MSQTMEVQQNDAASTRGSEEQDKKEQPKSRRPPNNAFRQQRLKAWQPILTPKTVLPLFFAVGVIFAPIGGLLLWASSTVQELIIDYSDCNATAPICPDLATIPSDKITSHFKNSTDGANAPSWCRETDVQVGFPLNSSITEKGHNVSTTQCHLQFYIPDRLSGPVLLYYQLTNFYQNHRRYVQSFDPAQLKGTFQDNSTVSSSDCSPLQLGKINDSDTAEKPYYPCGLIANSMFNDTFMNPVLLNAAGSSAGNVTYNMTNNGIAWSSDAALYGVAPYTTDEVVPPPNWRVAYPDGYNEQYPIPNLKVWEEFHVWMRTAGLPTFSKLALRNDAETMEIGRYEMIINDYFPVTLYDGTKSILLSTRTIMGGRNPFLGIAYIVVGGLCIVLGGLFTVTQLIRPRKLGDHAYLSWDQPSTATTTGRAPRTNEAA